MIDSTTLATRENITVHVDELKDGFNRTLDALSRLEQHARGLEKAKWRRLAKRVHSVINHADRVLSAV